MTDHKWLVTIFGPKKRAVPSLAGVRIQCWAVIFQAYNYLEEYRPSDEHANEDACDRKPVKGEVEMFLFSLD